MRAFTGIKDVDMKILLEVNDRSLLNICLSNKYVNEICKSENFWRNRFFNKYKSNASKIIKPKDRSWRDQYLQILIYKDYITHIWDFLRSFKLGNAGISNSIYINLTQILSPLPEWVIVNYYLLSLGEKLDIELETAENIIQFTLENPLGVTLSQISDKILERNKLKDDELFEFQVFMIPDKKNALIYISKRPR